MKENENKRKGVEIKIVKMLNKIQNKSEMKKDINVKFYTTK